MKEFNINDNVNVKLTDFGIAILRQNHENLSINNQKMEEFEIQVDENGYTKFQLVDLMKIFGQYFSVDQNKPTPFETTIMISEQNLKEPSVEKGKSL